MWWEIINIGVTRETKKKKNKPEHEKNEPIVGEANVKEDRKKDISTKIVFWQEQILFERYFCVCLWERFFFAFISHPIWLVQYLFDAFPLITLWLRSSDG